MSDSIPKTTPTKSGLPIWWIASGIFHALVIGWLVFFSPVRVMDLAAKKSTVGNVSPERAQQIMEQVREKQAASLADSVRDLQDIQRQLAELENRKRDEFQNFAKDFNKDAPAQAEQAQAAAAQAQADALALQASVAITITNALQTRADADLKQLDAQQRQSAAAQNRAAEFQERALEMLSMSDKRFAETYKAQVEANATQERAAKAQLEAKSARDEAKNSKAKDRSSEIAGAKSTIAAAEKDFADATAELVTMSNTLATAQSVVASGNTNSPQAIKAMTQAQKQVDSVQRKITNKQSQLAKYAQRVIDQKARLAKFQADAAAVAPAASDERLITLQTKAQSLQDAARESQSRARDALAAAKFLPVPAESGLASLPKPAEVAPVAATPPGEIEKMDLSQLYQTSVKTEDALTESYRRLRATELAMIRQIPLARALELTDTAKVVRPDLQSALANTADIAASRDAVQNTRSEINAIHQLASSLLSQARELDRTGSRSPNGTPVASDNLQSATATAQTLASLAAEDENARAKDLTAAMKRGAASGKPGSGQPPGTGGAGGGAGNAGSPGSRAGASSGGTGNGGAGGGRGGNSSGDGTSSGPSPIPKDIGALPGRTVAASGDSSHWMFVDSWYLLGPFDNAGRVNLEKKFPPETVVDRDATYEGKSGSKLRWEFYQVADPKIVPPFRNFTATKKGSLEYIIYYACTELRFAEECDLWIAVGSDDFSKVWVNDQLVWASGKQQKDWRVDEGLRKVHFQKGVNRILYRVENGHGGTAFSLVVGMP